MFMICSWFVPCLNLRNTDDRWVALTHVQATMGAAIRLAYQWPCEALRARM